jgi:LCP family protein required for cell wall assembly
MSPEQRPRRNTNIDGFIRPQKKPSHAFFYGDAKNLSRTQPTPALQPTSIPAQVRRAPMRGSRRSVLDPKPTGIVEPIVKTSAPEAEQTVYPAPLEAPLAETGEQRFIRTKSSHRWKRRLLRTSFALVIVMLVTGGWLGSRLLGNVDKVFHGSLISDVHALSSTTKLSGESTGRVNILLAGDSADDPGHQGADLTDSIMVVSIDTQNHTGFMLSIPRDTWVDIPGVGHSKINAANDQTNFSSPGYPNGGMGQLQQIITTDFGIPINYYGLIDYAAFKDAVDAVGGITVNIQSSDPRGLYDAYTHLKLANGEDSLTGQQALDLARARGDDGAGDISYGFPQSDYDRTEHQRQMLSALEQKATTIGVLSDPLKLGQLFNALGNNVQTNFNLADVLRAAQITKGMSVSSFSSLTLGDDGTNPLLKDYTAPDGEEALIPAAGLDDYNQIQQYYQELASGNANAAVVAEAPTAVVLNGSDVIGLAGKEAKVLEGEGFNVTGVTDANNEYPSSEIIDSSDGKMPAALSALNGTFKTNTTTTTEADSSPEAGEANGYTADFVIVLGKNWDKNASGLPTTTTLPSTTPSSDR